MRPQELTPPDRPTYRRAHRCFDGRGRGDLHAGTFLQLPIPCGELGLVGMACYTFGGNGDATALGSVYGSSQSTSGVR